MRKPDHAAHVAEWRSWLLGYIRLRCRIDEDGCWHWLQAVSKITGLPMVGLPRMRPRTQGAHRVAWFGSGRRLVPGLVLVRSCADPLCCNPEHSEQVTRREAMQRASRAGTLSSGARHSAATTPNARRRRHVYLDLPTVRQLRARYAETGNAALVAREAGLGHAHVHRIVTGKCWREPNPFSI